MGNLVKILTVTLIGRAILDKLSNFAKCPFPSLPQQPEHPLKSDLHMAVMKQTGDYALEEDGACCSHLSHLPQQPTQPLGAAPGRKRANICPFAELSFIIQKYSCRLLRE